MFLRTIDPKSLGRHLELASRVAEGHEGEDPDEDANCVRLYILQRTDIHSLGTRRRSSASSVLEMMMIIIIIIIIIKHFSLIA